MTAVMGYKWGKAGIEGQILCGREFMNTLSESSFEEIKSAIRSVPWLDAYWNCGDHFIKSVDGRISYTFTGLRHNLESIKSKARILLAWVDEAEPVTEAAWRKLIPTVREEGSEIWVTWNPEDEKSATHLRFRAGADESMKIVEMNWRDNPMFPDVLNQERLRDKELRPDTYDHIWEGDFLEIVEGAYLKQQLQKVRDEDRISNFPILDSEACSTFWDIGNSDGTAIWVMQKVGMEYHLVDFYEEWNVPYSHAAKWLQGKGYMYDTHFLPHDAGHKRQGEKENKSPQQMLEALMPGNNFEIVPRIQDINWGIQQLRDAFPMFYFHKKNTEKGVTHLKKYKQKWSENEKRWLPRPDKSEGHSEAADALRQLAQAHANGMIGRKGRRWGGGALKRGIKGVA